MSFDIEAVNDVSMSLGYLQRLYLPFVPCLTRRHVSFVDTSANSTPEALPSHGQWKLLTHAQCTSVTTFISSSRTAAPASGSSLRRWTSSLPLRWRSNECKVHLNGLVQQLGIMCPVNRSSSLVQSWVFNERIALKSTIR